MSTEEDTARQLVVFTIGAEQYAVPITQVQEIILYTPLRSVASNDPWMKGVLSLRGKIVPVYDLGARLGVSTQLTEDSNIMILDTGAQTVGLIVEAVDEVLSIEDRDLENAPGADRSLIESIATIDQRLVALLDVAGIFGELSHAAA
jgi:purine-binding chemotaxis protein CheW